MRPLVTVINARAAGKHGTRREVVTTEETQLYAALAEIIPAALHGEDQKFAPNSIDVVFDDNFRPFLSHDYIVVIEDYDSRDWPNERKKRVSVIHQSLSQLFPDKTFDIRIRPCETARSHDVADALIDSKVNMSMPAANDRARTRIAKIDKTH